MGECLPIVHKDIWFESQHHIYKPCTVGMPAILALRRQEKNQEFKVILAYSKAKASFGYTRLVSTKPNKQTTI